MNDQSPIEKRAVPALRSGGQVAAFVPRDLDEIWRMARMAVIGKMAPKSLVEGKDPDEATSACAIAIMAGAELGLTPLMSLRSYAVVNGRPSLWGDGIKAVVRNSGICDFIKSGADLTKGWCEARRSDTGETKRVEFTWAQAVKAKLSSKSGPWQEHPDMMMERRATFRCLNDLFADVLGGVASAEEAIDDGPLPEMRDVSPSTRPTPPSPPLVPAEPDAPVIDEPEEAVTGTSFDVADYFEQLEGALVLTSDLESLEDAWNEADPYSTFDGDATNIEIADKIKARHMTRIEALKAAPIVPPSPPSPKDDPDFFPGDAPFHP